VINYGSQALSEKYGGVSLKDVAFHVSLSESHQIMMAV